MRIRLTLPCQIPSRRALWVLGCGLVSALLLLNELVGQNGYWQRQERHQQVQAVQEEIQKLQQDNQRLGERVQELRSDPDAIEKRAREQLRLGRPGEIVVTLPPDNAPSPAPSYP